MTVTISRLYNSYPDAQAAIKRLEAAGVKHGEISVLASNADGWYKDGQAAKPSTFPDRDLDGKDGVIPGIPSATPEELPCGSHTAGYCWCANNT